MKRIKLKGPAIKTREEMETLVGQIAAQQNFISQTTTLMDQRIIEVRAEYEQQIAGAQEDLKPLMEAARSWCEANGDAFAGKKSIEMVQGIVGFRTGTPKLKTLAGWTWDRVLEKLRTTCREFIRTKEEVDKEAIIGARENLLDGDLRNMGVKIVQDESFFVEPKLTPVENRQTTES